MSTIVIKRDGSKCKYDFERIKQAILKAKNDINHDTWVDNNQLNDVFKNLDLKIQRYEEISIELIQKYVENELMNANSYFMNEIARSYIEYRTSRDIIRESKSSLTKDVEGLLKQTNIDLINENANKDSKIIPTQRDLLAGITAKNYAKKFMLPKEVVKAHDKGEIHYHDLDYSPFFPIFNCMLIDLKGMLENGFRMGNAEIETPKSISTATAITAQIIAQVASHIYGGNTINRIDEILAPYVTKSYNKWVTIAEDLNCLELDDIQLFAMKQVEKECYDAFQALEYEINTLHTSNG